MGVGQGGWRMERGMLFLVSCLLWQRDQTVVGPWDTRLCLLFLQPVRGYSRVRGWSVALGLGRYFLFCVDKVSESEIWLLLRVIAVGLQSEVSTGVDDLRSITRACCQSYSMDIWILFPYM